MSDSEHQKTDEVMALMRQYLGQQVTPPEVTTIELKELLREARERRVQRKLPPQTNLSGDLRALAEAWQTTWTDELRDSEEWQNCRAQLAEIRQLLVGERLSEASEAIELLLGRCSANARRVIAADSVRQLSGRRTVITAEQSALGLSHFLRWLHSVA